jgi:hypothetical protein
VLLGRSSTAGGSVNSGGKAVAISSCVLSCQHKRGRCMRLFVGFAYQKRSTKCLQLVHIF